MKTIRELAAIAVVAVALAGCRGGTEKKSETKERPAPPGVEGVQVAFSGLKAEATWKIGETADWVAIAPEAVFVAGTKPDSVQRIDPEKNKVVASVALPAEACSGLEFGFESVWVPVCSTPPSLVRIDAKTNRVSAALPVGPAQSEGGIAVSSDSVWLVTDIVGTLVRIDPSANEIRQKIQIPAGSYNPVFSEGMIWISEAEGSGLTAVDAVSGKLMGTVTVGPKPRFLAASAGSVWTLNQGDGTISRVDARTQKLVATIHAGLPGPGGDLCFGGGSVWATLFDLPLTRIDPETNKVVRQWKGSGGDSMRFGHGSIWLTDYRAGTIARIPLAEALKP